MLGKFAMEKFNPPAPPKINYFAQKSSLGQFHLAVFNYQLQKKYNICICLGEKISVQGNGWWTFEHWL